MNTWINLHTIIILGACWFVAQCLSVMPPLPVNSGWVKVWLWNISQIISASLQRLADTNPTFKSMDQHSKVITPDGTVQEEHKSVVQENKGE